MNPRDLDLYKNRVRIYEPEKTRAQQTQSMYKSKMISQKYSGHKLSRRATLQLQLESVGLNKSKKKNKDDDVLTEKDKIKRMKTVFLYFVIMLIVFAALSCLGFGIQRVNESRHAQRGIMQQIYDKAEKRWVRKYEK